MTETAGADTTEAWRLRGQEDAPIALRAIARSMFQYGKGTPGYACASAIIEAYARDLKRVGPGAVQVTHSEQRLRLLTQLMSDANQKEWMEAFLGAPESYMSDYSAGFLNALNNEVANWAASPWKPGTHPDLVAEEEKWHQALCMGDLLLEKSKSGWKRLLGN